MAVGVSVSITVDSPNNLSLSVHVSVSVLVTPIRFPGPSCVGLRECAKNKREGGKGRQREIECLSARCEYGTGRAHKRQLCSYFEVVF